MKKLNKPMQEVILATAINGIKADNGNRKALRALANALNVSLDEIVKISPRNGKGHYNFGEIAECVIRLAYGYEGDKQTRGQADLTIKGRAYEIKAVNRDGKPSPTVGLDPQTPTLIFANLTTFARGIYQLPYGKIKWNTSKHMIASETLAQAKLIKAI